MLNKGKIIKETYLIVGLGAMLTGCTTTMQDLSTAYNRMNDNHQKKYGGSVASDLGYAAGGRHRCVMCRDDKGVCRSCDGGGCLSCKNTGKCPSCDGTGLVE
jgi:rubrerythrin